MNGAPKGMPLPAVTRTTEPFWKACAEHRLVVQKCGGCGVFRHSPAPICSQCHSKEFSWEQSKGEGSVYTYTIAHHPVHASLRDQVPYAVVVVQLDDCGGVCIVSNLLDTPIAEIRVGLRVKVAWDDLHGGMTLPRFVRA